MKRGLNIAGQLSFRHHVSPENLLTNLYHLTAFAVQRNKLVHNDGKCRSGKEFQNLFHSGPPSLFLQFCTFLLFGGILPQHKFLYRHDRKPFLCRLIEGFVVVVYIQSLRSIQTGSLG